MKAEDVVVQRKRAGELGEYLSEMIDIDVSALDVLDALASIGLDLAPSKGASSEAYAVECRAQS